MKLFKHKCLCFASNDSFLLFSDFNECSQAGSYDCRNGGSCVNIFADYQCNCVAGWTGRLCEIGIPLLISMHFDLVSLDIFRH